MRDRETARGKIQSLGRAEKSGRDGCVMPGSAFANLARRVDLIGSQSPEIDEGPDKGDDTDKQDQSEGCQDEGLFTVGVEDCI